MVERAKLDGAGKVFLCEGVYAPLIDPPTFDRAQRRLDTLSENRGRRKRTDHSALTGVLICDHCGSAMYATRQKRPGGKADAKADAKYGPTFYRCSGSSQRGLGTCPQYRVREDDILPFVLRMLGKEITDLRAMLSGPPENLRSPYKERAELRRQAEQERQDLADRIEKAEEAILDCEDKRTRQSLDKKVSAMRDELDRLEAILAAEPKDNGYSREDLAALSAWWEKFWARAVSMPVSAEKNLDFYMGLRQDPFADESAILVEPRNVNDALLGLGTEVRLRWRTERYRSRTGAEHTRHVLARGRFRLGQRKGNLPRYVVEPSGRR